MKARITSKLVLIRRRIVTVDTGSGGYMQGFQQAVQDLLQAGHPREEYPALKDGIDLSAADLRFLLKEQASAAGGEMEALSMDEHKDAITFLKALAKMYAEEYLFILP